MKNTKQITFVFAALCSIGAATAANPRHYIGTTYYAVTVGAMQFRWTTTRPLIDSFVCLAGAAYCTIITNGTWDPLTHPNTTPFYWQATLVSPSNSVYGSRN